MQRRLNWISLSAAIIVAAPASGVNAFAQMPTHLSGLINDFTPQTTVSPAGPWEIHGAWQLTLHGESGTADFTAELTMEMSDYAIVCCGLNPDTPAKRSPHTHTITLAGGKVTTSSAGFQVTGPVAVTASGSPKFAGSTLTVAITGGTAVPYSNISLTFVGPATGHFGTQALNGVVRTQSSGAAPAIDHAVNDTTGQICVYVENPSCVLNATQSDNISIYGSGFEASGNVIKLTSGQSLESGDGSNFVEGSTTLINAQLTCGVTPGSWAFAVRNPTSNASSPSYAINVAAKQGC